MHHSKVCGFHWLVFLALTGCATAPKNDYTLFRQMNPKSVLIIPAINRSVEVNAPDYYLSTISRPVAERGYYVFPVHLVKRLLEDDGLADADMVHRADPKRLAEMFGADAILYVIIERWDARYAVFSTTVTVEFTYILKSGETGDEIWRTTQRMQCTPQHKKSGNVLADLITMTVSAAVAKALPNYIPLTQQANATAVAKSTEGLPVGPYHPKYQLDTVDYPSNFTVPKE